MSDINSIGRGIEYLRLVIYHNIRFINSDKLYDQVFYFNLYPLTDEINIGDTDDELNNKINVSNNQGSYFYCLVCMQKIIKYKDDKSFFEVIDHLIDHQINHEIYFENSESYKMTVKDLVIMRFDNASGNVGSYFHYYISKLGTAYTNLKN